MTSIQFYILASDKIEDRWHYTQRLVSQSVRGGRTVHIHTACSDDTRAIVERIENHSIATDEWAFVNHVSVNHQGEPDTDRQVLINLSDEVPHFFSSFETTLEVIHAEPKAKAVGRERYRYYQDRGYPLRHKEIQLELAIL